MRLFIAVDLSDRSCELLENKVDILQDSINQNLKWVKKENWHLTLKFLGDTPEEKLGILQEKILESTAELESFKFQLSGISAFPDPDYPKVVYAAIDRGHEQLKELYNNLEQELTAAGFEADERSFTPHLTLARTSDNVDHKKLAKDLEQFSDKSFLNIFSPAREVHLYESKLLPEGPKYKKIFSISLN